MSRLGKISGIREFATGYHYVVVAGLFSGSIEEIDRRVRKIWEIGWIDHLYLEICCVDVFIRNWKTIFG
jgi:hypothetical protein